MGGAQGAPVVIADVSDNAGDILAKKREPFRLSAPHSVGNETERLGTASDGLRNGLRRFQVG